MRRTPLFLLVAALSGVAGAQATFDLGGEVAAEFGVAVDGRIPVSATSLRLDASGEIGSGFFPDASFRAELLAGYDAAEGDAEVRLENAHATLYLGDVDLKVGQQVVFWGSADGVNPVDTVNPRDLSKPIEDPAEQKLPVPMVRGTYHGPNDVRLDAVLIPVWRPGDVPDERWQTERQVSPPPGVTIVGEAPPVDNRPEPELGNVQFGARATFGLDVLSGGDLSVAYFHGLRGTPTVSTELVPTDTPGQVVVQPVFDYDMYDLVGVDVELATQNVVFRGEAAYTMTGDPEGVDPRIQNHDVGIVLGAEYTFPGDVVASLSGIADYVAGDAGEDGETTVRAMLAGRYEASPRVELEGAWLHSLSDGSGLIRPAASYTFADGVTGTAELEALYGTDGSEFGDFRDNSALILAVEYAF